MFKSFICLLVASSMLISQENYRSTTQIESEWGNYTKFQRDEMISFCDFLFNERYYERCLVSSFQFLYRFPNDPIKPALLFLIARSYEEMENYSLARRYYRRVMDLEPITSIAYKSSKYREVFTYLMEGEIDAVFSNTEKSEDPYFLIMRGYSYLQLLDWESARATFISAEEKFKDKHYSKLMIPLYQSIENVSSVKQHSKLKVAISGLIFPGGGQLVLRDKTNAQGIFISTLLLYGIYTLSSSDNTSGNIRFDNSAGMVTPTFKGVNSSFNLSGGTLSKTITTKSALIKYTLPPIAFGSLLYISSFIKSFSDTEEKNKDLIYYYAREQIDSIPPRSFMDFEEPSILNNNYK